MTDSSKHPEKKHSQPWYRNPSALISLGAMTVALISAAISAYQVNLAQQQNTASEQQELLTLVGNIAQDPANIAQQSLIFKNNTSAISQAQAGAEFVELADAEEAINIVGLLKGNGVTATEYYEIAIGLQPGESYGQALSFSERPSSFLRIHGHMPASCDLKQEYIMRLAESQKQSTRMCLLSKRSVTYRTSLKEIWRPMWRSRASGTHITRYL